MHYNQCGWKGVLALGADHPGFRYSDEETKSKLIAKLFVPIKKHGIASLRTDDIARYLDLSKATLYKYFESKDDIITSFVDLFISLFDMSSVLDETSGSYQERYQVVIRKMLVSANYGSDIFLRDLRALYPDLMERLHVAWLRRTEILREFYERGMDAGIFVRSNVELLIMQDELTLAKLSDPAALAARNLACRQALTDYYRMRVHQIFVPGEMPNLEDEGTMGTLDMLAQKITNSMM